MQAKKCHFFVLMEAFCDGSLLFSTFTPRAHCVGNFHPVPGEERRAADVHGARGLPRRLKSGWEQQQLDLDTGTVSITPQLRYISLQGISGTAITSTALLLMLTFSLPDGPSVCSTPWKGTREVYPDTCCQNWPLFPLL